MSDGGTRKLATVLFTDMVGSTEIAAKLGDARWRELLRRHHEILRRDLKRFGGREIDTAGDGVFAIFDVPAQAVRCAGAIAEETQELGVDIRAGLHVGEVEIAGREVRGIAVHTGSRVCASGGPTDVLVTSTLTELVGGSGIEFGDRGVHTFKGVPGEWRVFNVTTVAGAARPAPLDPARAEDRLALIEPPPFVKRHRGWFGAGAAAAVAALVLGLALAPRSPPPPKTPLAPLNSVIAIDPANGKITQQGATELAIDTNFSSQKMAAGEGAVWLLLNPDLFQLDPVEGSVRSSIPNASDYAVGRGAIWIAEVGGGLESLDPATGAVLKRARGAAPISVSPDAVWSITGHNLVAIDPQTGRLQRHFPLSSNFTAMFATATDVWLADITTDTLTRIDVRSGHVMTISLAATPNEIVVSGGYLWALDLTGGTVTVIEASTGRELQVIPVSAHPTDLAYGLGAIWVPDGVDGMITRIDAATRQVSRVDVGVPMIALTADGSTDSLWAVVAKPSPPD